MIEALNSNVGPGFGTTQEHRPELTVTSDRVLPAPGTSPKLGSCEVCARNEAKYTCPRCEVKTCCLQCTKIHKLELECSRVRDRTKFIPINKFTNMDLSSDYRLLEEITRSVELLKKNRDKRATRVNQELPNNTVLTRELSPVMNKLSYFDAKKKVDTMVTPSTSFAQVATAPARMPIQAVQEIGPEIKSIDVKELERELLPRLVDALKAVFALRKDSTEEVTSTKLTLDINRENKKRKDDKRTPPEEKGCIEGSQPSFSQQKDINMVKKPKGWPKGKTRKPRDESQDSLRSRSTSRESTHKGG
ncbi:hypothetical protein RN001_012943 [Aquatica leii]|uniref:HIT-type domain-containing protein n=1 Tax=Aquatica leii TaxID=1421715 RepID=A0AAN7SLB9_9COLE|nr:hypothetical protein RN001_012943 [Aquatica leii]